KWHLRYDYGHRMDKQRILEGIWRTAKAHGSASLGRLRFFRETGILFLIILCSPSALPTTYVVVKFHGTIVAGADSCSTLTIDHVRHVRGPDVCTIHKCADHTYFL